MADTNCFFCKEDFECAARKEPCSRSPDDETRCAIFEEKDGWEVHVKVPGNGVVRVNAPRTKDGNREVKIRDDVLGKVGQFNGAFCIRDKVGFFNTQIDFHKQIDAIWFLVIWYFAGIQFKAWKEGE